MFGFLKKLFVGNADVSPAAETPVAPYKVEPPVLVSVVETATVDVPQVEKQSAAPKRAKNAKGKFVGNNHATPENEAWVGGKAPVKKAPARKPAAKTAAAKKKTAAKK